MSPMLWVSSIQQPDSQTMIESFNKDQRLTWVFANDSAMNEFSFQNSISTYIQSVLIFLSLV